MPLNPDAKSSLMGSLKNAGQSLAGFTEKAVIEAGDFSEIKVRKKNAAAPSSGSGFGTDSIGNLNPGDFDLQAVKSYATSIGNVLPDDSFELYGNLNKFRFICQFNPNELYINGYGGEEIAIQKFRPQDGAEGSGGNGDANKIQNGSTMASANTRIDMSFRIAFDKSNPQDAFYSDKFTLSQTNLAKGVARGAMKAAGKLSNSVQPEVEALTSIVRNGQRRLVKFIWGDMLYTGVLNSVNAEYVMFNVNGEPCRAFVSLSMVLYDSEVAGANTDIWQSEYQADFWSLKSGIKSFAPSI